MILDRTCRVAITGAADGIGWALAQTFAARDVSLALIDIDGEALARRRMALERSGCRVESYCVDVADRDAVFDLAGQIEQDQAGPTLLVNNAGVSVSGPFESLDLDDFMWLMGVNFWGAVNTTKAFLPMLLNAPHGAVVNVLSGFGLWGFPTKAPYCSSKFALRGFTQSLRADLARTGITVHEVYPPAVKTGIVERGRTWDEAKRTAEAEFLQRRGHTPESVAEAIVRGLVRNRQRIFIGADTRMIDYANRLFPSLMSRLIGSQGHRVPFV